MRRRLAVVAVLLALPGAFTADALTTDDIFRPDDYGTGTEHGGTFHCPQLSVTLQRGSRDSGTKSQVSQLQLFLSDYFELDQDEIVSGFFGSITHRYVVQFQKENELPALGIVGAMTRAVIEKLCSGTAPLPTPSVRTYTQKEALALIRSRIMPSVVQIECGTDENWNNTQSGSGVYTRATDGTPVVVTNAHVVRGVENGQFNGCNVYFPRPLDGGSYDSAYAARRVTVYDGLRSIVSGFAIDGIDYAELEITEAYANSSGTRYPFPPRQEDAYKAIQALCSKPANATLDIGDPVYTLGYPGIGGSSITVASGIVSGFSGPLNEFLKVSASTLSGNSGGVAVGTEDICLYGIPTQAATDARVGGNIGFVLTTSFVSQFLAGLTGEEVTVVVPDTSDPSPGDDPPMSHANCEFKENIGNAWYKGPELGSKAGNPTLGQCLDAAKAARATVVQYTSSGNYPLCSYGHASLLEDKCGQHDCGCTTGKCWPNTQIYSCTYTISDASAQSRAVRRNIGGADSNLAAALKALEQGLKTLIQLVR